MNAVSLISCNGATGSELTPFAQTHYPELTCLRDSLLADGSSLDLIERYLLSKGIPAGQVSMARADYYRFLLLVRALPSEGVRPTAAADEFWHAHILHTKQYSAWTARHFGRFLHHVPDSPGDVNHAEATEQGRLEAILFASARNDHANAECGPGCSGHCGSNCATCSSHCGANARA